MVVNAQHVKQIKGRKTDIADSAWLSRICQFGLGSPSLVLPGSLLLLWATVIVEKDGQISGCWPMRRC